MNVNLTMERNLPHLRDKKTPPESLYGLCLLTVVMMCPLGLSALGESKREAA